MSAAGEGSEWPVVPVVTHFCIRIAQPAKITGFAYRSPAHRTYDGTAPSPSSSDEQEA